ncbi:MAG TPA: hypothetical protein VL486_07900 [Verrucomicrobiae bacterium]|nr:hypothetical protein [Verrucomicrobiae bacterium]
MLPATLAITNELLPIAVVKVLVSKLKVTVAVVLEALRKELLRMLTLLLSVTEYVAALVNHAPSLLVGKLPVPSVPFVTQAVGSCHIPLLLELVQMRSAALLLPVPMTAAEISANNKTASCSRNWEATGDAPQFSCSVGGLRFADPRQQPETDLRRGA